MKTNYFMKSLFVLMLVSVLFSLCTKKNNDNPSLPEAKLTLLTQEQIGPGGGTLSSEGISINIPEGAFGKTEDISLFSKELLNGHPLAVNALSGLFQVEGIPSDFSKPITVKIKGNSGNDTCYLVNGAATYYSKDTIFFAYKLAETTTDGEYMVADIIPGVDPGKSGGSVQYDASHLILEIILNSGFRKYTTIDKLITIDYPSYVPISSIRILAKYFNEAHLSTISTGFQYSDNYLIWIGKEWLQKYTPGSSELPAWVKFPLNIKHRFPGYMTIQREELSGENEDVIRIGHFYYYPEALSSNADLLILEQSAFRAVYLSNGILFMNHLRNWYNSYFVYDLAAWAQELVTINQGFKQPLYFDDYIGYSLNALADRKIYYLQSGYSPQLKYVYDHFPPAWGSNLMINIFSEKFSDDYPSSLFQAIADVIGKEIYEWYPDFMEKFLKGNIYEFDYSGLTKYISVAFTVKEIPFSGENEQRLFLPTETRLYRFNIGSAELSYGDSFTASVEHLLEYSGEVHKSDVKFMAYIYDNNSTVIQHIATANGEITIPNLKQYQNNESILLAVCYAPHIDKTNQIELGFKIEGGPGSFNHAFIKYYLLLYGRYLDNNPPTNESVKREITIGPFDITGINGSTIIAKWDNTSGGIGTKGDIEIYFEDATFSALKGFEVKEYSDHSPSQWCTGKTHTEDYSLSASGLDVTGENPDETWRTFKKEGCDGIIVNSFNQSFYDLMCHIFEMDSSKCVKPLFSEINLTVDLYKSRSAPKKNGLNE